MNAEIYSIKYNVFGHSVKVLYSLLVWVFLLVKYLQPQLEQI